MNNPVRTQLGFAARNVSTQDLPAVEPPVGVGKFNERLMTRNQAIVDLCRQKADSLQTIVDRLREMANKLEKDGPAAAESIAKYVDYMTQSQETVNAIRMVGTNNA